MVFPAQSGFGDAVAVTPVGIALTVTLTVETTEGQLFAVAVKLYTPDANVVALGIVGFCKLEINPFGPVQEKVVPISVPPVKLIVLPEQTGLLLPANAVGIGLSITVATVEIPVDASAVQLTTNL